MEAVEEKVDELIKAAVAVKAALGGLKEQIEAEAEQDRKRARHDSSPPSPPLPHTHCEVRIASLLTISGSPGRSRTLSRAPS